MLLRLPEALPVWELLVEQEGEGVGGVALRLNVNVSVALPLVDSVGDAELLPVALGVGVRVGLRDGVDVQAQDDVPVGEEVADRLAVLQDRVPLVDTVSETLELRDTDVVEDHDVVEVKFLSAEPGRLHEAESLAVLELL